MPSLVPGLPFPPAASQQGGSRLASWEIGGEGNVTAEGAAAGEEDSYRKRLLVSLLRPWLTCDDEEAPPHSRALSRQSMRKNLALFPLPAHFGLPNQEFPLVFPSIPLFVTTRNLPRAPQPLLNPPLFSWLRPNGATELRRDFESVK